MRTFCAFSLTLAVVLAAAPAFATHPDHEGERGFELTLQPGVGIFTNTDDRVFLQASDFTSTATPTNAFGAAGFAFRASLGYRVIPLFSAGLSFGLQTVSASGLYDPRELTYNPSDALSNVAFGAYARFYFLSLVNGTRDTPRVFFQGATDRRRFEAWATLGVDFISGLTRTRSYSDPLNSTVWRNRYIGVPIGVGGEYRVTNALAVGLALIFTPLVGASTEKTRNNHVVSGGDDHVESTTTSYTPAAGNAQVFIGLSARYTLTLF